MDMVPRVVQPDEVSKWLLSHAKVALRSRISLFRSLPIPLPGFNVVLWYAFAGGIHHAKVELRVRISVLGFLKRIVEKSVSKY